VSTGLALGDLVVGECVAGLEAAGLGLTDEGLVPDGKGLPGLAVVVGGVHEDVAVLEAHLVAGEGGGVAREVLVAEPGPFAEGGVEDLEEALVGTGAGEKAHVAAGRRRWSRADCKLAKERIRLYVLCFKN